MLCYTYELGFSVKGEDQRKTPVTHIRDCYVSQTCIKKPLRGITKMVAFHFRMNFKQTKGNSADSALVLA
jgi:hypothetical protein